MITQTSKDTTTLPVSLSEAKDHLRVDGTADDLMIIGYLHTAREFIEEQTGKDLTDATYELSLPDFPGTDGTIVLVKLPVTAVASVKYYDTDNTLQTLDDTSYHASIPTRTPAKIQPVYGTSWPDTYQRPDAVTVTYTTGNCPKLAEHAMKLLVGSWYETRSDEDATGKTMVVGAQRLIDQLQAVGYW